MAQNGKSGRLLIDKLFRRERYIKTNARPKAHGAAKDTYDSVFLQPDTLDESNKVERLMRHVVRRLQRAFSQSPEAHKPFFDSRQKVSVARVVYGLGHAIQLTMANSAIIEHEGFLPGDVVIFLNGQLKGQNLLVVNVPDSTHLLLEDFASYSGTESNISVRIQINNVKRSYR